MRPSRAMIICSLMAAPLVAQAQIAVRVTTDPDGGPGLDVLSSGTTRVHVFADGNGSLGEFLFDLTDSGAGLTFTNLRFGPVLTERLVDEDLINNGFFDHRVSEREFGWSKFIGPALVVTEDTLLASFTVDVSTGPDPTVLSLAGPAWRILVDGSPIDDSIIPGSGDALVLAVEATGPAGGGGAAPPAGGVGNTVPPIPADQIILDDGPVLADPRQVIQFVAVYDPIEGTLEIGRLLDESDADTTVTRDPDGAVVDGIIASWDADGGVITSTGLYTAGSDTGEFVVRLSLSTAAGTLLAERVVLIGNPTVIRPADDMPDGTTSPRTGSARTGGGGSSTPDETAPTAASSGEPDAVLPAGGLCGAMGMVEMLTLSMGLGLIGRTRASRRHGKA